jgi:signal transduction histidine kinase
MQDIPKLFTALAELLSCILLILEYYSGIKNMISAGKILTLLAGGIALAGIQLFCGTVSNVLWLIGMAAAAFEWQIYSYYKPAFSVIFCIIFYVVFFAVCYVAERYLLSLDKGPVEITSGRRQLTLIWISTLMIFALSNLSYVNAASPFSSENLSEIFNIRTLVDMAGLFMFDAFRIQIQDSERRKEVDAISYILKLQYMQFRESQENINLINQKYHDLKHQLHIIRNERDDTKRTQYLDEIESGIKKYETEYKTGNSVLDTILTSKGQQCDKFNIKLTVVADGQLLGSLHVMDICTIFGNALDNAIEYEVQIDEITQRMIHVSVSKKSSFICILVENYYEKNTEDSSRFLKTSKKDDRFHGFGIRSIRYAVQKYGGYVKINVLDHWFRVEILIPHQL